MKGMQDAARLTHALARLRMEYQNLDLTIEKLMNRSRYDELQLNRLKKRRQLLKDTMARIESQLILDLDA